MKEITGNLWDYYQKPDHIICLTTNGFVKQDGTAVMGRGCAKEATERVPGIARKLASFLKQGGNHVFWLTTEIVSFPVKHNWWEQADRDLIIRSRTELCDFAIHNKNYTFILPRPGCGNGRLKWEDVKPLLEVLPDNVWVISR